MTEPSPSLLRFTLTSSDSPQAVLSRFHPRGSPAVNRTRWHGKEPRTCAVVNVKAGPLTPESPGPVKYEIVVSHKPRGCVTYTGGTQYRGWTAMVPNRSQDGTLLDAAGAPLLDGQPPVLLPVEVYDDMEFNDLYFGDFIGEEAVPAIAHRTEQDVWALLMASPNMAVSMSSDFVAPRRSRPYVKVVISQSATGVGTDNWGTRIVNVCCESMHLREKVADELFDVVCGFIEGRFSIKNLCGNNEVFVDLSDVVVDCSLAATGQEPQFDCLNAYLSDSDREDMAKRLMAIYDVVVSVVDGPKGGLLIHRRGRTA